MLSVGSHLTCYLLGVMAGRTKQAEREKRFGLKSLDELLAWLQRPFYDIAANFRRSSWRIACGTAASSSPPGGAPSLGGPLVERGRAGCAVGGSPRSMAGGG